MTEAEWLACADPLLMLEHVKRTLSDRKLRLFAFACVRRFWDLLPDDRLRRAIEASELHADGKLDSVSFGQSITAANRGRPQRNEIARAAYDAARYVPGSVNTWSVTTYLAHAAAYRAVPDVPPTAISYFQDGHMITEKIPMNSKRRLWEAHRAMEFKAQCDLLRDIVGNPFRPHPDLIGFGDSDVRALAKQIYETRAFDRVSEIADLFDSAGYTDSEILAHCRGPGPHVRGCWVIDGLLGNE